jgi:hypothetical protein
MEFAHICIKVQQFMEDGMHMKGCWMMNKYIPQAQRKGDARFAC